MPRVIVVGSGAGGATAARELQGICQVTVLEAGGRFRPFLWPRWLPELARRTNLLYDLRQIQLAFPALHVACGPSHIPLARGICLGGSTVISTGSALWRDQDLRARGINLEAEHAELVREMPVAAPTSKGWRPLTHRLYEICQDLGLHPIPTLKMGDYRRCRRCGRCMLGCPTGAKWDSRRFLQHAVSRGARVRQHAVAERILLRGDSAVGVVVRHRGRRVAYRADRVILAAGGLGTPRILAASGITCRPNLFVDPVLTVGGILPGARPQHELSMPFIAAGRQWLLAPYFDYLSFLFNKTWRNVPAHSLVQMMIKLTDHQPGRIDRRGIHKTLGPEDQRNLHEAVESCRTILTRAGVRESSLMLGTIHGGHPGGTVPLAAGEAATLHPSWLPRNLYVADASLLPHSLGGPPILLVAALARKVARACLHT